MNRSPNGNFPIDGIAAYPSASSSVKQGARAPWFRTVPRAWVSPTQEQGNDGYENGSRLKNEWLNLPDTGMASSPRANGPVFASSNTHTPSRNGIQPCWQPELEQRKYEISLQNISGKMSVTPSREHPDSACVLLNVTSEEETPCQSSKHGQADVRGEEAVTLSQGLSEQSQEITSATG